MPESPLISPGDVVECKLQGRLAGQVWINVFHYRVSEDSDQVGLSAIPDAFKIATWDVGAFDGLKDLLSEDCTLENVTAQRVLPTRSILWPMEMTTETGNVGGHACPPTVAVVMRRRGFVGNRHNLGRIFVAGVPIDAVEAGKLKPANQADWLSTSQLMARSLGVVDGGDNATLDPVMIYGDGSGTVTPVSLSGIDYILRSQRRREVGRGI